MYGGDRRLLEAEPTGAFHDRRLMGSKLFAKWRQDIPSCALILCGVAIVLGFLAYLPFLPILRLPNDFLHAERAAR